MCNLVSRNLEVTMAMKNKCWTQKGKSSVPDYPFIYYQVNLLYTMCAFCWIILRALVACTSFVVFHIQYWYLWSLYGFLFIWWIHTVRKEGPSALYSRKRALVVNLLDNDAWDIACVSKLMHLLPCRNGCCTVYVWAKKITWKPW